MILEFIGVLLLALLGTVLATRITTNPFRIRYTVTESAANTYTAISIELPVAALARGKVQALEMMGWVNDVEPPDNESAQENSVVHGITRDLDTAERTLANDNEIYKRSRHNESIQAAAGETQSLAEDVEWNDVTDHDGNGEVVMERTIHAYVVGTGNAAAKGTSGYLLAHLVELDAEEVVVQAFVEND